MSSSERCIATVYCDGGCPNNQHSSSGTSRIYGSWSIDGDHSGRLDFGYGTNNQAEYKALIAVLAECHHRGIAQIHVFADSRLLVNQMNSLWKCNDLDLYHLKLEAKSLRDRFDIAEISWVPRDNVEQVLGH